MSEAAPTGEQGFRPLNVKDALSYLDRVKVTFQDQAEGKSIAFTRRDAAILCGTVQIELRLTCLDSMQFTIDS